SQLGSCPIQTPLATSAVTVHPTEQCVQTFLRTSTSTPVGGGGPASARRVPASGSAPSAARLPAAMPDRRRKERRSTPLPEFRANVSTSDAGRARRSVLLTSTIFLPYRG